MIRILTYNIEFGLEWQHIRSWLETLAVLPEVICFQEFPERYFQSQPNQEFQLRGTVYQARFTPAFLYKGKVYGECTLYQAQHMKLHTVERLDLGPHPWEDRLIKIHSLRSALLLGLELHGQLLMMVNLHLPWLATNKHRLELLGKLAQRLEPHQATVIVGDFNYTSLVGKRKLLQAMLSRGFTLANPNMNTHSCFGVTHQLDYVFYRDLQLHDTQVYAVCYSDHLPVLSTFEFLTP